MFKISFFSFDSFTRSPLSYPDLQLVILHQDPSPSFFKRSHLELKTTDKDEKELEVVSTSIADANEISLDAAVAVC